eukprot:TRINITY_DN143_c0_g1_i2.p1 TRINITY_DN143_c0_g1~~TRINITY_DN143_c0_g1_i2.p1  ORF type:complete len:506 (+),score=75.06 TRINITY_DN143_c0_g1_i2:556-2073(+)
MSTSRWTLFDRLQATFRERLAIGVRTRRGHYLATNDCTQFVLGDIDGNHMSSMYTKNILDSPVGNDHDVVKSRKQMYFCFPQTSTASVKSERVDYGYFLKSPCFDKFDEVSHICTFFYNVTPVNPAVEVPIPLPLIFSATNILLEALKLLPIESPHIRSAVNNSQMLRSMFLNQLKCPVDSIPTYDLKRVFTIPTSYSTVPTSPSFHFTSASDSPSPGPTSYSSPSTDMDDPEDIYPTPWDSEPNNVEPMNLDPAEAERDFDDLFSHLSYDPSRNLLDLNFELELDIAPSDFELPDQTFDLPQPPPASAAASSSVSSLLPTSPPRQFFYCGSSLLVTLEAFLKGTSTYTILIAPDAEMHLFGHRLLFLQALHHLLNGVKASDPSLVKVLVANSAESQLSIQVSFKPADDTRHLNVHFLAAARSFFKLLGGSLQLARVRTTEEHLYTVYLPQARGMSYPTLVMTMLHLRNPEQPDLISPLIPRELKEKNWGRGSEDNIGDVVAVGL